MRLGRPKAKPPKREHRQAVDLADGGAGGVEKDGAAADHFLTALAQPVGAANLRIDGLAHLLGADHAAARLRGPMVGLAQDVADEPHPGAQFGAVAGQPRGLLDHACDARGVQGAEPVAAGEHRHQPGVFHVLPGAAVHVLFEIDRHFEELAEIGFLLTQEIVERAVPHQHDLDIERDRFGIERDGADQAVHLARRFDTDLAGLKGPLEGLVRVGLHQELAGVED